MVFFRSSAHYFRLRRLLRHALFWIAYYLYDGPISSIIEADPLSRIVIAAIAMPVKIAATYLTLYLMTTVYHDKTRPVRFYAYLFASIIFFGFMQRAVSYNIIYPEYYPQALDVPVWYLPKVIIETFGVYSVVAIVVVLHVGKQWYKSQQEKQQLKSDKLEAELKLLKAQIHPHFLFNTLITFIHSRLRGRKRRRKLFISFPSCCVICFMTATKQLYRCKRKSTVENSF